jgi:hypothetical protein
MVQPIRCDEKQFPNLRILPAFSRRAAGTQTALRKAMA